jgi:hypothetical protein
MRRTLAGEQATTVEELAHEVDEVLKGFHVRQ